MQQATIADIDFLVQKLFQRALNEAIEISFEMPSAGTDIEAQIAGLGRRNEELVPHLSQKTVPDDLMGAVENIVDELRAGGIEVSPALKRYTGVRLAEAEIEENRYWRHQLSGKQIPYDPADQLFATVRPTDFPSGPWEMPSLNDRVSVATEHETAADKLALADAVEIYCQSKSSGAWRQSTERSNRRTLSILVACLGADRDVKAIRGADVRRVRDIFNRMPVNADRLADRNGLSVVELAKSEHGHHVISAKSKKKHLEAIKAFLRWLASEEYVRDVPGETIGFDAISPVASRRTPYSSSQLVSIFTSPLYRGSKSQLRRTQAGSYVARDGYFWLPLIALYSGMRLGEINQLLNADIREESGIWIFDVCETEGSGKTLKSAASARRIPIHHKLIELGFLEKPDFAEGAKTKRVFHDVSVAADGCFSRVPSKWWGRYARGIGVANSNNAFHSFRHSFVDALREADTGEAVARMLMGHSDGSVHGNYGQGVSLQKLKQSIDRVTFPEVERCFLDLPQATD